MDASLCWFYHWTLTQKAVYYPDLLTQLIIEKAELLHCGQLQSCCYYGRGGTKKECHDQVFTMMRLDTCHCLSCSYSFFAASTSLCIWSAGLVQSFCKSGHFNHLALSTSGELSQNGRNIPESMHRMRYTLLFPLEWLQVNKLMPVEDAGNPRCQHKDFQPSSFFFPVAWSRTGAGLMLSQSEAGDGCTWAELLGDKGNQKVENRLPCCLTYCCTQTVKRQGRWQEQEKVTIITICCSWDTLC